MTQITSVNGSYHHGLAFASHSLCFSTARRPGPALFVSGPGALCALSIGLQRSLLGCVWSPDCLILYRSSALFSARPALSGALSVSGPGALCRRVCWGPAIPGDVGDWVAVSVRLRRSLGRGPALFVSGPALCVGPKLPLSRPGGLCVGPQPFLSRSVSRPGVLSGPGALCRGPALGPGSDFLWRQPAGTAPICVSPQLPSARHPSRTVHPAAPSAPPIQPGAIPFSRREPQTLLFGG